MNNGALSVQEGSYTLKLLKLENRVGIEWTICAKKWHIGIQTLTRTLGNWLFVKMGSGKGHVFIIRVVLRKSSISLTMRGAYGLYEYFNKYSFQCGYCWSLVIEPPIMVSYCSHYLLGLELPNIQWIFHNMCDSLSLYFVKKFKQGTSIAFKEDFWHGHLEQLWTSMCQLHWPSRCTITSN